MLSPEPEADMRRREFLGVLSSAAIARPLAARAQQPNRMRRIGVLMNSPADDPEGKFRFESFLQELQQLGWGDGRNVRIDIRWGGVADPEKNRKWPCSAKRSPAPGEPMSALGRTGRAGPK